MQEDVCNKDKLAQTRIIIHVFFNNFIEIKEGLHSQTKMFFSLTTTFDYTKHWKIGETLYIETSRA